MKERIVNSWITLQFVVIILLFVMVVGFGYMDLVDKSAPCKSTTIQNTTTDDSISVEPLISNLTLSTKPSTKNGSESNVTDDRITTTDLSGVQGYTMRVERIGWDTTIQFKNGIKEHITKKIWKWNDTTQKWETIGINGQTMKKLDNMSKTH